MTKAACRRGTWSQIKKLGSLTTWRYVPQDLNHTSDIPLMALPEGLVSMRPGAGPGQAMSEAKCLAYPEYPGSAGRGRALNLSLCASMKNGNRV